MPFGLFDYENVIEPMGLSPRYDSTNDPIGQKVPQEIPSNTSIVTRAIPENPPQNVTMAIPENVPSWNPTTLAYGETGNPFTVAVGESGVITDGFLGSEALPITPITLAMPESGVIPTPPSGGCPAGYSSAGSSPIPARVEGGAFNQTNPYGLTAGQYITGASTGKPFNVNQAGNTWIPTGGGGGSGGGATNTYGQTNRPMINSEYWGRAPVSATAPSTWSGTQQQYTSMLNQLGINTAR